MSLKSLVTILLVAALIHGGCGKRRVKLATTTSVENSGLLDLLLPPFEKRFDVDVDVISVGTGKALALARRGDVDLVLVHAPEEEEEFVRSGFGVGRREIMYNDFILVGPMDDPARINGVDDVVEAMKRIRDQRAIFVSRGDESGTHKKELQLWRDADISPSGHWYLSTGQGMGPTLFIADQKEGYTLVDRGTYLVYRDKIDLVPLLEGDRRLLNPYGIIAVNPSLHPHTDHEMAMALIDWITSPQGQKIIGDLRKDGQRLFHPARGVENGLHP